MFDCDSQSLKNDSRWSDVVPVEQDDGPCNVARISYTDEFKEVFDYLRAMLQTDERSERAFWLTEKAVRQNPANYTVWFYRRRLIRDLKKDLQQEMYFLDEIIEQNPKNYQVWFHRQKISEMRGGSGEGELLFVKSMLDEDSKNYHAWQYRQWLLKHFNLWQHELSYVNFLINDDVRNNSAWNQRYFVIQHTTDYTEQVLQSEIVYTLDKIAQDIYNESPWNYLRGITQNMETVYNYEVGEPYNQTVLEHLQTVLEQERSQLSPFMCMFYLDCMEEKLTSLSSSQQDKDKHNLFHSHMLPILDRLKTTDDVVRKNYWTFVTLKLQSQFNLALSSSS